MSAPDFTRTCDMLAGILQAKNEMYGNSYADTGTFLRMLWPNGCSAADLDHVMLCARMFDKMKRLAAAKPGDEEDPLLDLAGYAVLGLANHQMKGETP